jgi:hypothetical protein
MCTKIVSKVISYEIYEFLKKAENNDHVNCLDGKIQFYNKPYLKLLKLEIKEFEKISGDCKNRPLCCF